MSLFAVEEMYEPDQSPPDNTEIKLTYLYYSQDEMKEFKSLAKAGMKKEFEDFQADGNISDLVLKALKTLYGTKETRVEETPNGQASGSEERVVSY